MRRAAVTIVAAAALRQPQRANRAVTRRAAFAGVGEGVVAPPTPAPAADAFAGLGEGVVAPTLAPAAAAVDPFARLGEGVVAAPPDATPLSAPALLLLLAAVGAAALVWLGQNLEPNPDARAALGLPEPNLDARAALGLPAAAARPELFAASDAKAYYVVRWRARGRRGRHAIIIAARGCLEPSRRCRGSSLTHGHAGGDADGLRGPRIRRGRGRGRRRHFCALRVAARGE